MKISDVSITGIDASKIQNISLTYCLNDISSANIAFIPSDIKKISSDFYNEASILIDGKEIFNGLCMGVQTEYYSNSVNIHTTINSAFHKMVQIGLIMLGIVTPDGLNTAPLDQLQISLTAKLTDTALKTQNIVGIFKLIIDALFNFAKTAGVNRAYPVYEQIYTTIATGNQSAIENLFNNYINYSSIPVGVPATPVFIQSTVNSLLNSQNLNLWSFLMTLCDYYMLCTVTTMDGKNKIIVHEPFFPNGGKIIIPSEDISTISISPIQQQLYTRLLLTTDLQTLNVSINTLTPELMQAISLKTLNTGHYPVISKAGIPTKLEEKLKSIKMMRMVCPGALTWKYNNPQESTNNQTKLDNLAKALWLKETLKYRTAIIGTNILINKYNVGDVVVFKDEFFNKTYQGQISKINLMLSGNNASMTLYLQYVIEDSEKELFDYEDFKNPLYT